MGIKLIKKNNEARMHLGRCKNCGSGWTKTNYLDELEPDVRKYFRDKGYADNADICPKCVAAAKKYLAQGKADEALSPKMQKRLKLKAWQAASTKMKGFDEAGYSFLDLYEDGRCEAFPVPTKGYETEKEALAAAKKIFDDFDEYLEVTATFDEEGGPDGEPVWFPSYGLKKTFTDVPEGEGVDVLSELSDVLYRLYTKGA